VALSGGLGFSNEYRSARAASAMHQDIRYAALPITLQRALDAAGNEATAPLALGLMRNEAAVGVEDHDGRQVCRRSGTSALPISHVGGPGEPEQARLV
jgi:hypothetical protein